MLRLDLVRVVPTTLHFEDPRLLSTQDNTRREIIEQTLQDHQLGWAITQPPKLSVIAHLSNHTRSAYHRQKNAESLFVGPIRTFLHLAQIVNLVVIMLLREKETVRRCMEEAFLAGGLKLFRDLLKHTVELSLAMGVGQLSKSVIIHTVATLRGNESNENERQENSESVNANENEKL